MKPSKLLLIGSFVLALAATLSTAHVIITTSLPWLFPAAFAALILSMLV